MSNCAQFFILFVILKAINCGRILNKFGDDTNSENIQLSYQGKRSPLLDFYYLTNTPDEDGLMHQPGEIARLLDRRMKHVSKTKVKRSVRSTAKVWDHWGHWTPCSQTCGSGKMTRWRHCVSGGCSTGEKEAQIRTCNNAECKEN